MATTEPKNETGDAIDIRRATVDDLDAARLLLSQRDSREWDSSSTAWFLCDMDPKRCLVWLAWQGQRPVGLSCVFVRTLVRGEGTFGTAYWANLYIDPEYRHLMLYPRLPLAMLRDLREAGFDFLYGCIRLRDLAQAHLALGFAKVGQICVLIKPLRPARLLIKHRHWPRLLNVAAALVDPIFHGMQLCCRSKPVGGSEVAVAKLDSLVIKDIVQLLNKDGGEQLHQCWSEDSLRYRYAQTREGGQYHVLTAQSGPSPSAVLIYRIAERDRIRTAVVMGIGFVRDGQDAARAALAQMQREAYRAGCEAILYLDGQDADTRSVFQAAGYRQSSQVYDMLVWPKDVVECGTVQGGADHWRFTFGDHDAF